MTNTKKISEMKGFWEGKKFWPACDYPATKKRYVKAGEIKFWVETEGKGKPLILIHGGPGGNHCYFHPNLSKLAKRHRLIYYDLRGHYMSTEPKKPDECGVLYDAKDLEALRKALKLDKIDILGHSYGGVVAFMYGLLYPENIGHIIFCSTPVDITDEEGDRLMDAHPISKEMEKAKSEEEEVELYYKLYFHKPLDKESRYYQEFTRKSYKTEKSKRILCAYDRDKTEPNWKAGIPSIKKPMLFIVGKYDPLAMPQRIENIISDLPNAELIIFERSGHDPFVDEPDKFALIVDKFLSS